MTFEVCPIHVTCWQGIGYSRWWTTFAKYSNPKSSSKGHLEQSWARDSAERRKGPGHSISVSMKPPMCSSCGEQGLLLLCTHLFCQETCNSRERLCGGTWISTVLVSPKMRVDHIILKLASTCSIKKASEVYPRK